MCLSCLGCKRYADIVTGNQYTFIYLMYIHIKENNDIANQQFNDMDLLIKLIEIMYLLVIYT